MRTRRRADAHRTLWHELRLTAPLLVLRRHHRYQCLRCSNSNACTHSGFAIERGSSTLLRRPSAATSSTLHTCPRPLLRMAATSTLRGCSGLTMLPVTGNLKPRDATASRGAGQSPRLARTGTAAAAAAPSAVGQRGNVVHVIESELEWLVSRRGVHTRDSDMAERTWWTRRGGEAPIPVHSRSTAHHSSKQMPRSALKRAIAIDCGQAVCHK